MPAPSPPQDRLSGSRRLHAALPDRPLDVIAEDHDRIRTLCTLIDYIADRPGTHPEIISQVSGFVQTELPALIGDEADDLLPLMQRRCEPEDEIERLRARLEAEHATTLALLRDALDTLDALNTGPAGVADDRMDRLRAFAAHLRRHLGFENAVLMPLARARLTPDDKRALGLRMQMRRGTGTQPDETTDGDGMDRRPDRDNE